MRWFVRGDLDGFFGLALDNLIQLLLIDVLCRDFLGFPVELVYGRILPGVAVSLVIGNLYYAWQAKQVALAEGRSDVCAQPYGINTVSLFAFVFLVMAPVKFAAEAAGAADPATLAWRAGLVACFGSGLIELGGSFVAERLRRITPRAALLSTLAGIALGFISLGFLFRAYANPIVGVTTLGIVLLTYFGRVRFRGRLPGGLIALVVGVALAWITGLAPTSTAAPPAAGFHLPIPVLGELASVLADPELLLTYGAVIVPMGIFSVVGSLQNIEAAEAAGDRFPTTPSLVVNGLGSLAACLFGSCFPTTIYIGHPGWKAMGARAGYSILNAIFITIICLTGTLAHLAWAIPIDAGMAIVLWIGLVMGAQAFTATPRRHAPAVVIGLLPAIAAWGTLLAKQGVRVGLAEAGAGTPTPFGPWIVDRFQPDTWIDGGFALEQGFIFTSMILAAVTVEVIERRFARAGAWMLAGAFLSLTGIMHGYRFVFADAALDLTPALPWAIAYALVAAIFFAARWTTAEDTDSGHGDAGSGDGD